MRINDIAQPVLEIFGKFVRSYSDGELKATPNPHTPGAFVLNLPLELCIQLCWYSLFMYICITLISIKI